MPTGGTAAAVFVSEGQFLTTMVGLSHALPYCIASATTPYRDIPEKYMDGCGPTACQPQRAVPMSALDFSC